MVTDEQMIAATKAYAGIDGKCRPAAMRAALEAALSASDAEPEDRDEETYEIGKRDGYSEAVQQIDRLTGGDGEYRYCTDNDPDRHTPGPAEMIQRIVGRFETLNLLDDATKTGGDEPDDGPFSIRSPVFTIAQIVEKIKDYGQDSEPTSEYRLVCDDLVEAFEAMDAAPVNTSPDAVDAARYRFLRDRVQPSPMPPERCITVEVCDWAKNLDANARFNMWSSVELSGPTLDAEIDKLLAAAPKEASHDD